MTSPLRQAIERIRERSDDAPQRYYDVGVEWYLGEESLLSVGGRWDNIGQCWAGDNEKAVRFGLHRGQERAARDFATWLAVHLEYLQVRAAGASAAEAREQVFGEHMTPIYLWHWYGGRRGGKSHLAILALVVFAIAAPGARMVVLSPTLKKDAELKQALYRLVPALWRDTRGGEMRFITGSVLEFHTGGAKSELKLGRVDFAVANEAQSCRESSILDMRGNLADYAGPLILTYNPPRLASGKWLVDLHKEWDEGRDRHAVAHFFDRRLNPFTDREPLDAIKYSEQQYRRDVLGDMTTPLESVVFPAFSVHQHIRFCIPPDWADVTTDMARARCGHRCSWIGGLDFDDGAGCAWVLLRIYEDELGRDCVLIHAGRRELEYSEDQLDARLRKACEELAVRPNDIVWVTDASGTWQDTKRSGSNSWTHLRRKGWRRLVKPDPESERNPTPSIKRYDLARQLMREDRVHVLESATEVIDVIRQLPTKKDSAERNRHSPHVHLCDAWTYPVYRLFVGGPRSKGPRPHSRVGHVPRPRSATRGYLASGG